MTRDYRLDTLRGMFLAIMTIDHLGSRLKKFTEETLGFVSAAEGFIFLSGMVFALVYCRYCNQPARLYSRSLQRAWLIYRYHLVIWATLLVMAFTMPFYQELQSDLLSNTGLLSNLVCTAGLMHQPTHMDILPVYCIFLMLTPPVLLGIYRGYGNKILGLSTAIWFCGQYWDPMGYAVDNFCPEATVSFFNLLSWQLIWVMGLYFGVSRFQKQKPLYFEMKWLLLLAIVLETFFLLNRWGGLDFEIYDAAVDRGTLGWLRLVNFMVVLYLISYLMRFIPMNSTLPFFSFLGSYSLQVFSFHVLVVYLLDPISDRFYQSGGAIIVMLVVASLILPALFYRWLVKTRSNAAVASRKKEARSEEASREKEARSETR